MSAKQQLSAAQVDELEILQRCFAAIGDLMIPCEDLHVVKRDDLSIMLEYLSKRMEIVMEGNG